MESLHKMLVITQLARELAARGSWCGETHLQKATYLLQEIAGVDTGFEFVLYRHGPFSFDLRDQLTYLRGLGLLELQPQEIPYGPKLLPTDSAQALAQKLPRTLARYQSQITFAADAVRDRSVAELEPLATALYFTKQSGFPKAVSARAEKISEVKPHISRDRGRRAVGEVDKLIESAKKLKATTRN